VIDRHPRLAIAATAATAALVTMAVWITSDEPPAPTAGAASIASPEFDLDAATSVAPERSRTASDTTTTSTGGASAHRSSSTTTMSSTSTPAEGDNGIDPEQTSTPVDEDNGIDPEQTSTPVDRDNGIDPEQTSTLAEGDNGIDVLLLQRMLNIVTGADIAAHGMYGPATVDAVARFQRSVDLPSTGEADQRSRILLKFFDGGRSSALPPWPYPTFGDGDADGCQVAVVGDSLMSGTRTLHADRFSEIGCTSAVDGVGARSLAFGWQCRVLQTDGQRPLLLIPEPEPGNHTCAPSGLELLQMWSQAKALGDLVVLALGTNDATLFSDQLWTRHWDQALELTDGRRLVILTTQGRPGSPAAVAQETYSEALRVWCAAESACVLADWGLTVAAMDAASYVESVHLTPAATDARASFIRDVVAALLSDEPIPNPPPLRAPTTTTTTISASTTTSTVPPTSSTTSTSTTPSSTSTTIAEPGSD